MQSSSSLQPFRLPLQPVQRKRGTRLKCLMLTHVPSEDNADVRDDGDDADFSSDEDSAGGKDDNTPLCCPLKAPHQTSKPMDDLLDGFCKHCHHKIGVYSALELHADCAPTSERYRSSVVRRLGRQAFTLRLRLPPRYTRNTFQH
jgi:hypothetical protein